MFKVYFAGDLFDHKHITGNYVLARKIEELSDGLYQCMLPQNWEGMLNTAIDIRNKDIQSVIQSDLVLFNFDGTDLDSGTVVEFMVAKMLDIPAVLLRTDVRNGGYIFGLDWNLMVEGFPRCTVVKYPALSMYNAVGLNEMHTTIARSVLDAFEKLRQQEPLLHTFEELNAAYQHVIKMCGSGMESFVSAQHVQDLISAKIHKRVTKQVIQDHQQPLL